MDTRRSLDLAEKNALALARAMLPDSESFGGADAHTVQFTEQILERLAPGSSGPFRALQIALSQAARLSTGRSLSELSPERARRLVEAWAESKTLGGAVYALGSLYKATHFDRLDMRGSFRRRFAPVASEVERWHQQVLVAGDEDTPEQLECDAVVVGTGAGGAVVGRHLAERGHAVVFAEEGPLRGRGDYPGHFLGSMEHLYRATVSWGNAPMIITRGRLVGGSTAVNGGSTLEPPPWVMDRWCEDLRSGEFSAEALRRYFDTVNARIDTRPVEARIAGPIHDLLTDGARRLGWSLSLMPRNAPGCDGSGFCDNGCRAGARRSTDRSYVPGALERGGLLVSQLQVDELIVEQGRVVGVRGQAVDTGGRAQSKRVEIRAQVVVLAMGAVPTPVFLESQRHRLDLSDQVGRHLTLHPSGATVARFDRDVQAETSVPQGCLSEQFAGEGIVITSALPERHMLPGMVPFVGRRLTEVLEQAPRMAGAGFMLADGTTGRVRRGPKGRPLVTYQLSKACIEKVHRAHGLVAELLLASGAREVLPCMARAPSLRSSADLAAFVSERRPISEIFLASFHPLGTCRMSRDASDGVVDLDHQVHGAPGLFVVDGSSVRGPLGVNPQATIMALATRAAERIENHLD